MGATFLRNNLGKRSIAIDLRQEAGRELVLRLAPHFDVVAENFRAGALARLGLGPKDVAAVAPRAVYLSISGFGNDGTSPYADWPAYAPIVEAMAGLYEPNRKGEAPPPVVVAGARGDIASALFAVVGPLCALRERERTGRGRTVDLAMLDATLAFSDMPPFLWSMGAPAAWATAGSLGICAAFRARDGWFVVAVFREHHFERLARIVEHPEWCTDERFATREGWARHTEGVVRPALEAWAATRTRLEAARALAEQGIAAGPSQGPEDLAADPHVRARGMLVEVPRPDGERPMLVVGNPLGTTEAPALRAFPALGEHTDEVLRATLGLADAELERLRAQGAIA